MNGYIVKVVPKGWDPTDLARLLKTAGYDVLGVSPAGKVHVQLSGEDIASLLAVELGYYNVTVEG